jgi:hypothetical protein
LNGHAERSRSISTALLLSLARFSGSSANNPVMAKLTRYSSFEELKLDIQPNTLTKAAQDRVYAELEEFIKLLQQDLAAKKKAKRSNGQETNQRPTNGL